jgi:hypothetical protein
MQLGNDGHPLENDSGGFESRQQLAKQQAAIARAITNSDPSIANEVSRGFGLDPVQLQESHETLIRKRIAQTSALLPLTARIMGELFRSEFRAFANRNHFDGPKAIEWDAIMFVRERLKRGDLNQMLSDALRWELAVHEWRLKRFYWKRMSLKYDCIRWQAAHHSLPMEAAIQVSLWKFAGFGRIRIGKS